MIQLSIKPCKCDGESTRNYTRSSTRYNSEHCSGSQGQKTSGVILKLETRKKRGTFQAEGRMCTKQEDWESRSWLVPIY